MKHSSKASAHLWHRQRKESHRSLCRCAAAPSNSPFGPGERLAFRIRCPAPPNLSAASNSSRKTTELPAAWSYRHVGRLKWCFGARHGAGHRHDAEKAPVVSCTALGKAKCNRWFLVTTNAVSHRQGWGTRGHQDADERMRCAGRRGSRQVTWGNRGWRRRSAPAGNPGCCSANRAAGENWTARAAPSVLAPPPPRGFWGRPGPRASTAPAPHGPGWRGCAYAAAPCRATAGGYRRWRREPAARSSAMGGCRHGCPRGMGSESCVCLRCLFFMW